MRLPDRRTRREATPVFRKADRIYYHLGRDRAFNETLLKHWQQLMATYPKRGPIAIEDSGPALHSMRQVKVKLSWS